MSDETFSLFTIYKHPTDYPDRYVVRRFQILPNCGIVPAPDPEPLAVVDSLGAARLAIQDTARMGLICMPRDESDEPQIVETWL